MLKSFLVLLIEIYQKYISPYKGYRCGHGVFYKGDSCSCAVRKVIQRRGLIRGYSDIRNQFARCSYAYERLNEEKDKKRRKKDNWMADCLELPCNVIYCMPSPKKWCKGSDVDGCDLPCDCL